MADKELDFHKDWSFCAGRLSGLELAIKMAHDLSARWYLAGKDEIADALRNLANEMRPLAARQKGELEQFIRESQEN